MIMNGSSSHDQELCNGKIVYVAAGVGGRADIYSVDSDGPSTLRLTENPGFDGYPNWSFEGQGKRKKNLLLIWYIEECTI